MSAHNPGLQDALRALTAQKRKPIDDDRPAPPPGRKPKPLAGQLDLDGQETPGLDERADEESKEST